MSEGHCFKARPLGTSIHGYEARQPPPPGQGAPKVVFCLGMSSPSPGENLGK